MRLDDKLTKLEGLKNIEEPPSSEVIERAKHVLSIMDQHNLSPDGLASNTEDRSVVISFLRGELYADVEVYDHEYGVILADRTLTDYGKCWLFNSDQELIDTIKKLKDFLSEEK